MLIMMKNTCLTGMNDQQILCHPFGVLFLLTGDFYKPVILTEPAAFGIKNSKNIMMKRTQPTSNNFRHLLTKE